MAQVEGNQMIRFSTFEIARIGDFLSRQADSLADSNHPEAEECYQLAKKLQAEVNDRENSL